MDRGIRILDRDSSVKLGDFLRLDRLLQVKQISYFLNRNHGCIATAEEIQEAIDSLNGTRAAGRPVIDLQEYTATMERLAPLQRLPSGRRVPGPTDAARRELAAFIRALRSDDDVARFAYELRRAHLVSGATTQVGGHVSRLLNVAPSHATSRHAYLGIGRALSTRAISNLPGIGGIAAGLALGLALLGVMLAVLGGKSDSPQEAGVASAVAPQAREERLAAAINCDCGSIDPGMYGPRWIEGCQSAEDWLHELAEKKEFTVEVDAEGKLRGNHHCHLGIHGPAAWPVYAGPATPPGRRSSRSRR